MFTLLTISFLLLPLDSITLPAVIIKKKLGNIEINKKTGNNYAPLNSVKVRKFIDTLTFQKFIDIDNTDSLRKHALTTQEAVNSYDLFMKWTVPKREFLPVAFFIQNVVKKNAILRTLSFRYENSYKSKIKCVLYVYEKAVTVNDNNPLPYLPGRILFFDTLPLLTKVRDTKSFFAFKKRYSFPYFWIGSNYISNSADFSDGQNFTYSYYLKNNRWCPFYTRSILKHIGQPTVLLDYEIRLKISPL